jgi:deazaflavin-dependent oxidoreductase (nitroreductase family)
VAARRLAVDPIGEELARWGKVALIQTIGRTSGKRVTAAVGFLEAADGTLVVAAGSESADWALNLGRDATVAVTIGDDTRVYIASEVGQAERASAITDLILKYGTPAEKLGHGPVFRLVPSE